MASVTFNEIERDARRAFAYTLLVETTTTLVVGYVRILQLRNVLDRLLVSLSSERIDSLSPEQIESITRALQPVHRSLAAIWRVPEINSNNMLERVNRVPVFGTVLSRLQEQTEDIGDKIESMALRNNLDFRNLVSSCASALGIEDPGNPIAKMHR